MPPTDTPVPLREMSEVESAYVEWFLNWEKSFQGSFQELLDQRMDYAEMSEYIVGYTCRDVVDVFVPAVFSATHAKVMKTCEAVAVFGRWASEGSEQDFQDRMDNMVGLHDEAMAEFDAATQKP